MPVRSTHARQTEPLYRTSLYNRLSAVMCECETWFPTQREEHIQRLIAECWRQYVGTWQGINRSLEKITYGDIHSLYSWSNNIKLLKRSWDYRTSGKHGTYKKGTDNIHFGRGTWRKQSTWRLQRTWKDDIKMYQYGEIVWTEFIWFRTGFSAGLL